MLSGQRPFQGDHAQSVIHGILHEEPRPLPALRPEVPELLAQIVRKALTKDREARYHRATDILADLRVCLEDRTPASLGRPPPGAVRAHASTG